MTIGEFLKDKYEEVQKAYGSGESFFGNISVTLNDFLKEIEHISNARPRLTDYIVVNRKWPEILRNLVAGIEKMLSDRSPQSIQDENLNNIKQNLTEIYWGLYQLLKSDDEISFLDNPHQVL